jgi:hypothetical protein
VHLRVQRCTLDEFTLPARLFADVVHNLYRDDQFMRGELVVAGRRVGPDALVVPLLNVVDPRSTVVPRSPIESFQHSAASRHKAVLEYRGDRGVGLQHVGVLVGDHAQAMLRRQIIGWWRSDSWVAETSWAMPVRCTSALPEPTLEPSFRFVGCTSGWRGPPLKGFGNVSGPTLADPPMRRRRATVLCLGRWQGAQAVRRERPNGVWS